MHNLITRKLNQSTTDWKVDIYFARFRHLFLEVVTHSCILINQTLIFITYIMQIKLSPSQCFSNAVKE